MVDAAPQILPNIFDPEMADYAARRLRERGIQVRTGQSLQAVTGQARADGVDTDGGHLAADVVVLALGVRPATGFLQGCGVEMVKGAIVVDDAMRTSLPDVYAVGDCALVQNALTGQNQWSAMGSTANIAGRVLARALNGEDAVYGGCLGTGVVKLLPDYNAGRTGLTEAQARQAGFDPVGVVCVLDDKAHYYPRRLHLCHKAHRRPGQPPAAGYPGAGRRRGGQDGGHRRYRPVRRDDPGPV